MADVTLRAYKEEIDQMLEDARYLEAFAHLRHLLSQHPRYSDAYYLLGKMLLDTDQPELAVDMFRRVLNAKPEDVLARIGLGVAYQELNNNKAALWNLELAFENEPGNAELAQEIAQLRGQEGGVEPDYVPLTRPGLAQLYLKAGNYRRAVTELRKILEEQPQRADLMNALAEAYWRSGKIIQAVDVCQEILQDMPYNLKANLILGTLWMQSGQEEGEYYLLRAQEIDPQNRLATELFGDKSRLEEEEIELDRLVYNPENISVDQEAEWFKQIEATSASIGISELGPEMSDQEMSLVDITTGLDSQVQVPDWLEELGPLGEGDQDIDWLEMEEGEEDTLSDLASTATEEDKSPAWLSEEEEIAEEPSPAEPEETVSVEPESEVAPAEAEESTAWLQELQEIEDEAEEEPTAEAEGIPDWLKAVQPEEETPVEEEVEVPDWLQAAQPAEEAAPAEPEAIVEEVTPTEEEEEVPDWLRELQPPAETAEAEEEAVAPTAAEEDDAEMFGWTAFQEEEEAPAAEAEEIPDWLQTAQPAEEAAPAEPEAIAEEVAPTEEEEEVPDWLRELQPPAETAETAEEAVAPTAAEEDDAEMFGWTAFQEEEEAPAAEAEEIPDWLQEEPAPSPAGRSCSRGRGRSTAPAEPEAVTEEVAAPTEEEEEVPDCSSAELRQQGPRPANVRRRRKKSHLLSKPDWLRETAR